MKKMVAYYRVSTARQGKSGLGLEAQQASIAQYLKSHNCQLIKEFQEIRSTRKERHELLKALAFCKAEKAVLIVARLDRLGRDVEEIARIIKSKVDIVVADNPHANRFTIHILAAVAEEQRRTISENTRDALKAAKKRGKKLGKNGASLGQKNKEAAEAFALNLKPLIQKLEIDGINSTRLLAEELNKLKVPTFRPNAKWHRTTVHSLLKRLKKPN